LFITKFDKKIGDMNEKLASNVQKVGATFSAKGFVGTSSLAGYSSLIQISPNALFQILKVLFEVPQKVFCFKKF